MSCEVLEQQHRGFESSVRSSWQTKFTLCHGTISVDTQSRVRNSLVGCGDWEAFGGKYEEESFF